MPLRAQLGGLNQIDLIRLRHVAQMVVMLEQIAEGAAMVCPRL